MDDAFHLPVTELSQVGEARRCVAEMSLQVGLSETERGRAALVVTELATNLVKHATGGELFLRMIRYGGQRGVEILSLDSGPGMADVESCLRDGYSTVGTPGNGLGAVRRLSSEFGIWSSARSGSAVVARVVAGEPRGGARPGDRDPGSTWIQAGAPVGFGDSMSLGVVCRAIAGETECGDAWAICPSDTGWRLLLVDGLGHGPVAAEAAAAAVGLFRKSSQGALSSVVDEIHRGARHTRGAAMALLELDPVQREVRFVGVGNIAGVILTYDAARNLMSHNGTVGHQMRRIQQLEYPWPTGSLLVLHSDGIKSRWSLDRYPGLLRQDPALVAGVLYRDFARDRDDRSVVAVRAR